MQFKKNPWGKNIMPLNVIQQDRITIGLDSSAADIKCYSPKIFKAMVIICHTSWLAVWLSGNTLASINVVALRQTRLVLGLW